MLGLWLGMQFIGRPSGLDTHCRRGVAYWAHAGGFIVGMVLTIPLWLRLGGPKVSVGPPMGTRASRKRPIPQVPAASKGRRQMTAAPTRGLSLLQCHPHRHPTAGWPLCHALAPFLLPPAARQPAVNGKSPVRFKVTQRRRACVDALHLGLPIRRSIISVRFAGIYMIHQRRSDPAHAGVNHGDVSEGLRPWTQGNRSPTATA